MLTSRSAARVDLDQEAILSSWLRIHNAILAKVAKANRQKRLL